MLAPCLVLQARYPWLSLLSSRESDLLKLCLSSSSSQEPSGGVVDLSQSLGRSYLRQCCPCVTPSGRFFSLDRHRLLLGVEKLALQGLVFYDCPELVSKYSDDFVPCTCFFQISRQALVTYHVASRRLPCACAFYGSHVESQVELGWQQLLWASFFVSCHCHFRVDGPGEEELVGWQPQTCTFARQLLFATCRHCNFATAFEETSSESGQSFVA